MHFASINLYELLSQEYLKTNFCKLGQNLQKWQKFLLRKVFPPKRSDLIKFKRTLNTWHNVPEKKRALLCSVNFCVIFCEIRYGQLNINVRKYQTLWRKGRRLKFSILRWFKFTGLSEMVHWAKNSRLLPWDLFCEVLRPYFLWIYAYFRRTKFCSRKFQECQNLRNVWQIFANKAKICKNLETLAAHKSLYA